MFENIERVKAPSRADFYKDYVYPQKPVILTNLFEGQPISELNSIEKARSLAGDMPVLVQEGLEDYFVRVLSARMGQDYKFDDTVQTQSTVNGYLEMVEKDPSSRLICAEVPSSMINRLESRYTIPSYCQTAAGQPDDFVSMLWMGNAGNVSHLHYDGDFRHLFQYNLFGRKRVLLVPPHHAKKLVPVRNNSALSPQGLTGADLEEFVRYVRGFHAVLQPGETIYMPAGIWHYFEYLDTSMAITLRFHRNPYVKWLSENIHFDIYTQGLIWKFVDDRNVTPELKAAFAELQTAAAKDLPPVKKGEYVHGVAKALYEKLCTDHLQGKFSRPFMNIIDATARNELDILSPVKLYQPKDAAA